MFGHKVLVNNLDSFYTDRMPFISSTEIASLEKFEKTFSGIVSGDLKSILERLLSHHPLYNGENHPRMYPSDCLTMWVGIFGKDSWFYFYKFSTVIKT